jgi:ATP-binding cassette, subfamily B (MDR/TAP), member 1
MEGEGSRLISEGDLNVGLVVNVLFAILIGSFQIAQLTPRIQAFISATSAAHKVFQTIRRIPSIDSLDEGGLRPDLKGNIQLSNVSFIYPSRPEGIHRILSVLISVTVLKDVSLTIPEGKFTAIVGASGSGKSTIIHLLERFYDPVEGSISINAHDLKTLNVPYLRSCIKLVSQEPTLFASSIFENICHG